MNDAQKRRSKRAYAIVDQIKPNIVGVDFSASDENNREEIFPEKKDNQQQELAAAPKKASFKTKEVRRLSSIAGTAPVIPKTTPYMKTQEFIDYALNDQCVWKYSTEELLTEKVFNLYLKENDFDSGSRAFLIKVLIFIESLERGKNIKAIWLKNNDPEASVDKQNLTLIGKRYFLLLNEFESSGIAQHLNQLEDKHEFFHLLRYFALLGRMNIFWRISDFKNDQAMQLNDNMLLLRRAWVAYQAEYSKNLENMHYIKNLPQNQIFSKDRLIFRFKLKANKLQNNIRLLSTTFTELMKRLQGKYRLSEDIKYIKYTNEQYFNKHLDVLFFIEPNEKFESIQEVKNSIQDHWLRAMDYVLKDNSKLIITNSVEWDAELQQIMKTEELFQTESLYVGTTDREKIKKAIDVLIPYFISQAIFFPVKSSLPKTRQLTLVGFDKKRHYSIKPKNK
ncbi:hypothetical protein [Acinetobacter tandoii]|uniref:hypothetical protein n=1 Tax=Acinetobacter tandoii TaxID=202954 RepID=UPI003015AFA9